MISPATGENEAGSGFSVIGLGQCSLDILGCVPCYPAVDSKVDLTDTLIQGGGPVATALVVLARLGENTAFVGKIGDDDFGLRIRQGLQDEGVDCRYLLTDTGATSQFSFVAVDQHHGSRNIFCHRGSAVPLGEDAFPAGSLRDSRILHLDGSHPDAAVAAARLARQSGMVIVLDGGSWRPGLEPLLPYVDHLVVSETFAKALCPGSSSRQTLELLMAYGAQAVTVTLGSKGSWTLSRTGNMFHQPAFDVAVVDTTGCGDVFHGGYIYGLLQCWPLDYTVRFAAACAAIKATALGGRSAIPELAMVKRFLADASGSHELQGPA
ncbi:MAG: PfkB family carbohydrate kinase [Pedobacter sp.]